LEAFIYVPLLPILIEALQESLQIGENEELNDKASSMFNLSNAIGCIIGPIMGGFFNDMVGFRATCDTMAFLALTYSIAFFIFNILPEIKEKRLLAKGISPKSSSKIIASSQEQLQTSQANGKKGKSGITNQKKKAKSTDDEEEEILVARMQKVQ
jgi:MFS family permease